jgi:hypothetical protein
MTKITVEDFEEAWATTFSPWVCDRINGREMTYREVSADERDAAIITVVEALMSDLVVTGRHRSGDWERGWGENLEEFQRSGDVSAVLPRYFSKVPLLRWRQQWIMPESSAMEYDMLGTLLDWVFDEYLSSFGTVYEFGCGTGHNLLRLRERYPETVLWGLDWANSSQELIAGVASSTADPNLHGARFDYFEPNRAFSLAQNSAVFTMASLEQIGTEFGPFVDYLLEMQPEMVIHIEPLVELLDPTNLIDSLSIQYFRKRNYLDGLVTHLRELADDGKIEIIREARTFVGSFFIDGYSLVIWRPLSS